MQSLRSSLASARAFTPASSSTARRGVVAAVKPTRAADYRALSEDELIKGVAGLKAEFAKLQYLKRTRGKVTNPDTLQVRQWAGRRGLWARGGAAGPVAAAWLRARRAPIRAPGRRGARPGDPGCDPARCGRRGAAGGAAAPPAARRAPPPPAAARRPPPARQPLRAAGGPCAPRTAGVGSEQLPAVQRATPGTTPSPPLPPPRPPLTARAPPPPAPAPLPATGPGR
jgi:ribosomal protein L29